MRTFNAHELESLATESGMVFPPHVVAQLVAALDAGKHVVLIASGQWLVIDELNRSNFDGAFGPLFTVLAGQAVTLPYKRVGFQSPISIVPLDGEAPADTDVVRVPEPWRLIATTNVFDRDLLFRLSYALMRRFASIEVESSSDDVIRA